MSAPASGAPAAVKTLNGNVSRFPKRERTDMADVLIIGAGPAGLAAATLARRAGATVRLLDSSTESGGQYWRHLPPSRPSENEQQLHHQWQRYHSLTTALQSDPGVEITLDAHVWAIEHLDDELRVNIVRGDVDGAGRTRESVTADALILATGAHDRALPVPGWTLPGVVTAGAAQAMAKGERIAIGERVVIAGAGPFLFPVAESVHLTGARVVGVYEAARLGHLARHWLARPWELRSATTKVTEAGGYARTHLRGRIPYRPGTGVIAINGTSRVESATVARLDRDWRPILGTAHTVACDAVCLGHGFTPRLELAIAAGCTLSTDRFVTVDEGQQTSVPLVFAAGEITGIGGVDLALAEGEIAGWVAAGGSIHDGPLAPALRARTVFTQFATRIAQAHRIRAGWTDWLDASTVICRCEEVDYGTLRSVHRDTQSEGLRSMKLTTRAGLGLCQGRICGRTVEHILTDGNAAAGFADGASCDRRPIATPIRLGELSSTPSEGKTR
jgi:NADPH-dependent 2,4-dienoyl-CoA reductase/sulfur reductase-like enzyme